MRRTFLPIVIFAILLGSCSDSSGDQFTPTNVDSKASYVHDQTWNWEGNPIHVEWMSIPELQSYMMTPDPDNNPKPHITVEPIFEQGFYHFANTETDGIYYNQHNGLGKEKVFRMEITEPSIVIIHNFGTYMSGSTIWVDVAWDENGEWPTDVEVRDDQRFSKEWQYVLDDLKFDQKRADELLRAMGIDPANVNDMMHYRGPIEISPSIAFSFLDLQPGTYFVYNEGRRVSNASRNNGPIKTTFLKLAK